MCAYMSYIYMYVCVYSLIGRINSHFLNLLINTIESMLTFPSLTLHRKNSKNSSYSCIMKKVLGHILCFSPHRILDNTDVGSSGGMVSFSISGNCIPLTPVKNLV